MSRWVDTCFLSSVQRKSRRIFWRLAQRRDKRMADERKREREREREREGGGGGRKREKEAEKRTPKEESAAMRRGMEQSGAERRLAQSAVNPVTSCRRGEESGAGVAEVSSLFIDLLNSAKEDRGPLGVWREPAHFVIKRRYGRLDAACVWRRDSASPFVYIFVLNGSRLSQFIAIRR